MERKSDEGPREQSKQYEQFRYDSMGTRSEGHAPASQRFMPDPSSSVYTNARPPEFNATSGVRPVLNFSIQTGEEFALEFMRDRANPRKPFVPNTVGDQGTATSYMELKGILGISHMGSESGSDVSMLPTGEKGRVKELEKKGNYETENKVYYDSVQSAPRALLGDGSSRGAAHGYLSSMASDNLSTKMKFLCSFGGRILPRPSDGKLRYVGGDTRIIRISKDISWQELVQKMSAIYNQAHMIKYQLPGEELDALVSVSCDEDLQNMIEECSTLEGGEGSQKLRMFLFSVAEMEDAHLGLGSMEGDSETQYVVAVNGMDVGQRKNTSVHGLASTSANDLDQLFNLNVGGDRKMSGIEMEAVGTGAHLMTTSGHPSTTPSSVPLQPSPLNDYGARAPSYQDRITHHVESDHHPFSAAHPVDSFNAMDCRTSIPSSMPPQYSYNSNYSPFGENSVPAPVPELLSLQQGGQTDGLQGGFRVLDSEVPVKEAKLKSDGPFQQKNAIEQVHSLENDILSHKLQDDGSVQSYFSAEVSFAGSTVADVVNTSRTLEANDGDHYNASGGAFAPAFANSEGDLTDFSDFEPPMLPQRVFHSERIHREQPDLLNRSSKSDDDSLGSRYLIPHSRPVRVPQEPITESVDPLHEGNPVSQAEQHVLSAKPSHTNPPTLEEGLMQFEKYKELAHAINQPEPFLGGNESVLNHNVRGLEEDSNVGEMRKVKGHLKEPSVDEAEVAGLERPSAGPGTAIKLQEDPSSSLPELHWVEMGTMGIDNENAMGQAPPFTWAGSSAQAVSRDESSACDSAPERGDILIDINDRFPPDLLSDLFNKARVAGDSTGISPLLTDETGLSLNMQNHEPKRWSFFRNLAPNEFVRKDVSLMDQDHIVFTSPLTKVEEGVAQTYGFSPFDNEGVAMGQVESQIVFSEEGPAESSGALGTETSGLHAGYIPSQIIHPHILDKGNESPIIRIPESEYEEGKLDAGHIGGSIDSSLGDFNISDLQIIKNEDLEELKELGSGTFGTVYHGKWRGSDVAIKRIKKSCFTGRSSEQERLTFEFWREAEILSRLHHPNVVAFYGVVQDGPGGTLATVTEFMVNGSLRHVLLRRDKYLDRRKRLIIAMDAAFGMEYLHSKNIVHFDLKCDNLLVNLKDPLRPICKVGDFGLSKIKRNTLVSGGVRGTLPWMAPELLNGSSNKVSEKVDVFSFGIVMWEILTGEEPYANMHYGAIIGGIVNNTLRPHVPNWCDPEWKRLMEQCWAPDPASRPSFTEIANRLRAMSTATQAKAHAK
ncbi:uncharacterized protein LOC131221044 [Magnolia sinica]|uniref:uncharacterized protein LOC131221044 n=1 Tax=Magnolia sinica TaxID=86752 RepID=UPI00265AABCC|nr:uncharacterized protein LOC131221044 [Magnolia sinica]